MFGFLENKEFRECVYIYIYVFFNTHKHLYLYFCIAYFLYYTVVDFYCIVFAALTCVLSTFCHKCIFRTSGTNKGLSLIFSSKSYRNMRLVPTSRCLLISLCSTASIDHMTDHLKKRCLWSRDFHNEWEREQRDERPHVPIWVS